MTFESSKIQGKKTKIGANHDNVEAVFHEDILLEIFIRLPDYRSAKRTGIVCRNWHSLISHNPQFIPRFNSHHHQHQDRYALPFAIFFRKADKTFTSAQKFQPICNISSKDSPKCCLNFLPANSPPMVIRGSCNDLLLVSPGPRWLPPLYVCNPNTKQYFQLPEVPRNGGFIPLVVGNALVCMPGHPNQFKVAEFDHPIHYGPESELPPPHYTCQPMKIFCSETREWERRWLQFPRPRRLVASTTLHFAPCNGILFWLEYESRVDRVIYLDLTSTSKHNNESCGVIAFPDDSYYDPVCVKEQIGAVQSVRGGKLDYELRLIQVVLSKCMGSISHLKVWKLDFESKDWVLVHHEKKLKMPKRDEEHGFFVAPFVHPTDGDVVFVVWGNNDVFQFNLKDGVTFFEKIDKLQEPMVTNSGFLETMDRLLSFPIVHPTWPTPLPTTE